MATQAEIIADALAQFETWANKSLLGVPVIGDPTETMRGLLPTEMTIDGEEYVVKTTDMDFNAETCNIEVKFTVTPKRQMVYMTVTLGQENYAPFPTVFVEPDGAWS